MGYLDDLLLRRLSNLLDVLKLAASHVTTIARCSYRIHIVELTILNFSREDLRYFEYLLVLILA